MDTQREVQPMQECSGSAGEGTYEQRIEVTEFSTSQEPPALVSGSDLLMRVDEEGDLNKRGPKEWVKVHTRQLIQTGVLAIVALFSIFVLGAIFSDSGTYTDLIATLDEKKANVMGLMATTAGASAAISLLPGDAGAPIAEKLIDLSSYFMVILAVIYLEKFLVVIFGTLTFKILVPFALLLIVVALFRPAGSPAQANLRRVGMKLGTFGLALFLVVPVSVWVSDTIDRSFEASLTAANESMQEATVQIEESVQDAESVESEDKGLFDSIMDTVNGGISVVTGAVQETLDGFVQQLNTLVDTLAVMIVTSCLVPIIVLAFFLWMIKMLTGINFGSASTVMNAASTKGRSFASSIKRSVAKE